MIVTIFGVIVVFLGSYLLVRRSPMSSLVLVTMLTLMGGSAAVILTSLGGSSIPPASVALGFFMLSVCAPGRTRLQLVPQAVRENMYLVAFSAYGFFAAMILPWVFAGTVDVVPMRPGRLAYIYETQPLEFTAQNITTAFYLVGTSLGAVAAYVAARRPTAHKTFVWMAIAMGAIHVFFGVSDVLLSGTAYNEFLEFFRNGSYSQLEHRAGSFVRIAGIMPEASVYATYAFGLFVLTYELWLRGVKRAATGWLTLALLGVLLFSISSTAIVSILVYFLILLLRSVLIPGAISARRAVAIGAVALTAIALGSAVALLNSDYADEILTLLASMTVEKGDSLSGRQRLFWAMQGFDAFFASFGLGIGPGSFRSSSIFTAILGSMGVFGISVFLAYVWKVLQPTRASTYEIHIDERLAVGVAAGWAAFASLIPRAISGASPNPDLLFGILCGAALSLRAAPKGRGPALKPPAVLQVKP